MKIRFLAITLTIAALPTVAAAQLQIPPYQPQQQVPCDAFEKNANGTWSPTRPVTIKSANGGAVSISPGVSFGPGVAFGGMNLYALLEQNCR